MKLYAIGKSTESLTKKTKSMEIKEMNKTDFAVLAKSCGKETPQLVFDNNTWYEQLTTGEVQCRHKLMTVRLLNKEALEKKTQEGFLPINIKVGGKVVALVCPGKTAVYYHIPVGIKHEMSQARQIVLSYAKHLCLKNKP